MTDRSLMVNAMEMLAKRSLFALFCMNLVDYSVLFSKLNTCKDCRDACMYQAGLC